jgi:hypothetical protein
LDIKDTSLDCIFQFLGATALTLAVQGVGSTGTVKLLPSRGAHVNKGHSIEVTPLHITAKRGSFPCICVLWSFFFYVHLFFELCFRFNYLAKSVMFSFVGSRQFAVFD